MASSIKQLTMMQPSSCIASTNHQLVVLLRSLRLFVIILFEAVGFSVYSKYVTKSTARGNIFHFQRVPKLSTALSLRFRRLGTNLPSSLFHQAAGYDGTQQLYGAHHYGLFVGAELEAGRLSCLLEDRPCVREYHKVATRLL